MASVKAGDGGAGVKGVGRSGSGSVSAMLARGMLNAELVVKKRGEGGGGGGGGGGGEGGVAKKAEHYDKKEKTNSEKSVS